MYIEFIIIYAALAVIIGLLVFILIKLSKLKKNQPSQNNIYAPQPNNNVGSPAVNNGFNGNSAPGAPLMQNPQDGRVVFCYNCGGQYSINSNRCPHCGAQRG